MLKADKLINEINILKKELEDHQSKCKHKKVDKKHGAMTGNIFNEDSYWTDFYCHTCKKRWREDGSL